MNYPLISEYINAIKIAEDNFNELSYLRSVLNQDGLPLMEKGDNSVVFKMEDKRDGRFYAVKCFTKEIEGRAESYRLIANELKDVSSPFLTSIHYFDRDLYVDTNQTTETEFPVLLMEWVEGMTLDKYLHWKQDDQFELEMLAYRFSQLAEWLIPQPFAHGDLKPDNILVQDDGTLVLIDYDNMYVPAMKGQKAREVGSPDFCHPNRTENDFDEHIDDFSLVSILLSLRAISINPWLLEGYGAADRLLFSVEDYKDVGRCQALISHFPSDPFLTRLLGLFIFILSSKERTFNPSVFFRKEDFAPIYDYEESYLIDENGVKKLVLDPILFPLFDTSVSFINHDKALYGTDTEEQLIANVKDLWADKYGVLYTDNKRKLFRFPVSFSLSNYKIREGTVSICDEAFFNAINLESITIPESLVAIGMENLVNVGCTISFPVFCHCRNLAQIVVESGNKLYDSRNKCNAIIHTFSNSLIAGCKKTIIPNNIKVIGIGAFRNCIALNSIIIPNSVTSIDSEAFYNCSGLTSIEIPNSVAFIGDWAFNGCKNLTTVKLGNRIKKVGYRIFEGCAKLTSIIIPRDGNERVKRLLHEYKEFIIECDSL